MCVVQEVVGSRCHCVNGCCVYDQAPIYTKPNHPGWSIFHGSVPQFDLNALRTSPVVELDLDDSGSDSWTS